VVTGGETVEPNRMMHINKTKQNKAKTKTTTATATY